MSQQGAPAQPHRPDDGWWDTVYDGPAGTLPDTPGADPGEGSVDDWFDTAAGLIAPQRTGEQAEAEAAAATAAPTAVPKAERDSFDDWFDTALGVIGQQGSSTETHRFPAPEFRTGPVPLHEPDAPEPVAAAAQDAHPEPVTEPVTESVAEPVTESVAEPGPASDAAPAPEPARTPDPEPEAVHASPSEPEPDRAPEPEPAAVADPRIEPEDVRAAEPELEHASGPEPVAAVDPRVQPEAVRAAEPEPELEHASGPEPVAAVDPRVQPEAVRAAEPEPELEHASGPEPVAAVDPRVQPEAVRAAEPEPESEHTSESEPTTAVGPSLQPEVVHASAPEPEAVHAPEPEPDHTPEPEAVRTPEPEDVHTPEPRSGPAPAPRPAVRSPLAGTGDTVPHVGERPPTYGPEPTAVPEADPGSLGAVVPDTVLEGAQYGSAVLRAVSVRGDSARYRGEPRRDALLVTRFGEGPDGLLLAVLGGFDRGGSAADGAVPPEAVSTATGEACRQLAAAIGRSRAGLAADLRDGARDRLRYGLQRLATGAAAPLRALAPRGEGEDGRSPASLHCLLVSLDPAAGYRAAFGVGPGGLYLLRSGHWIDAYAARLLHHPDGAPPVPDGPVPEPRPFRFRLVPATPGDILLLCTPGLAGPIADEPAVAHFLSAHWAHPHPPGTVDFLRQVQVRAKGYADDRTAAAVWTE